ncbi:MAG: hypothetical protein VX438_00495, partial [Planctomycetota bacterium]|nr:hypothetical protein [Planctomycetota bacterium]
LRTESEKLKPKKSKLKNRKKNNPPLLPGNQRAGLKLVEASRIGRLSLEPVFLRQWCSEMIGGTVVATGKVVFKNVS